MHNVRELCFGVALHSIDCCREQIDWNETLGFRAFHLRLVIDFAVAAGPLRDACMALMRLRASR